MPLPRLDNLARLAALVALRALPAAAPVVLSAQQPAPPAVTQQGLPLAVDSVGSPDSTAARLGNLRSRRPLVTRRDLVVSSALLAGAAVLIPLDGGIARELQRTGPQSSAFLRGTASGAEMIASPGAFVFGGTLYIAGLAARKRGIADVGWHTLEALAVSGQATAVLKGLFGRTRPYAAGGDAQDFDLGGGFDSNVRRSFPSGHTSTAFTLAAVIVEETSLRWPRARRAVAPLAYAAATSVGLARMYNDKHWASDVALGATIGMLSGQLIVRYAHGRTRNVIDRIALWPAGGR